MEDLTDILTSNRIPLHRENTEPPEVAANNAKKIVEFLIQEKGVEDNGKGGFKLEFSVLCVLGAGWDEVWEKAFNDVSMPGVEIIPKITAFDYNKKQINEFGKGKRVIEMKLGENADNDKLAEEFEEEVDVFIPSNLFDWIGLEESIYLTQLIDHNPPSVIVMAGKEPFTEYGQVTDDLRDTYDIHEFESNDMKYEVRYQAILYRDLEKDEIEPEVEL